MTRELMDGTTISNELDEAALDGDLALMQSLISTYTSFDPHEGAFGTLLTQASQDIAIFRLVIARTNFAPVSNEKKAGYLASIINRANRANHEPSPQREAARILIDEVGFNPNNKAGPGTSNALSAAAEQGDVETTIMVLNCRNRIIGFEDDAVRDLVVFGIRGELISVRDLTTPRGAEARGEQTAVQKLLGNRERMEGLQRAKEAADRLITEESAGTNAVFTLSVASPVASGGRGSGDGRSYALLTSSTVKHRASPASRGHPASRGGAVDVVAGKGTAAAPASPQSKVHPRGVSPTTSTRCCTIS